MFKLEAKVILSGSRIIILVYTARLLLVPGLFGLSESQSTSDSFISSSNSEIMA